jgi:uncharacterized protein (DUF362 family)
MGHYAVYLGACSRYLPSEVADVVNRALRVLPLDRRLTGRVVIKPNLVMSHPKVASDSFTRSEVVEGVIRVIQNMGENISSIDIVEKSGLGITTATAFRHAGYRILKQRYGVGLCAMEEGKKVRVVLERGRIHTHLTIAKEMAERNFLIFVPKLKTNVLSHGISGALKLNIGTIDGRERLANHHKDLPKKIVDILEIADPDLIVTDGVSMAFGGNQMTQRGIGVGVLVVATNALAHDLVCAKMLGLDPHGVEHIQEAIDRGIGPRSFDEIEVVGDFQISKCRAVTRKLNFGFYPVDRFESPMRIISGLPYCTGGCQGIFLDWLHMIADRKPKLIRKFPSIAVLIGKVTKPVEARKVLLVGNCALASRMVRTKKIIRIRGCPPSHKRIVWDMMIKLRLLAPLVRPSLIYDGFVLYPLKKFKGWILNLSMKSEVKDRPAGAAQTLEIQE